MPCGGQTTASCVVGKDANGKLCWYVGKDDICGGAALVQTAAST
jgi:hypothetical protein